MEAARESTGTLQSRQLWIGFLGGATAWFTHLLLTYGIAEFGCTLLDEATAAGLPAVTWMLITTSLLTCAVAAAATLLAFRNMRLVRDRDDEPGQAREFVARAGVITSGLFTFIIVVESIPILYYWRDC